MTGRSKTVSTTSRMWTADILIGCSSVDLDRISWNDKGTGKRLTIQ
jgi:hypothetical protein